MQMKFKYIGYIQTREQFRALKVWMTSGWSVRYSLPRCSSQRLSVHFDLYKQKQNPASLLLCELTFWAALENAQHPIQWLCLNPGAASFVSLHLKASCNKTFWMLMPGNAGSDGWTLHGKRWPLILCTFVNLVHWRMQPLNWDTASLYWIPDSLGYNIDFLHLGCFNFFHLYSPDVPTWCTIWWKITIVCFYVVYKCISIWSCYIYCYVSHLCH